MSKKLKDGAAKDAAVKDETKPVETPVSAVDLLVLSDTDHTLGQAAWDAYSQSVGGKAYNGDPLPSWGVMREDPRKQHLVKAWVAAARAVVVEHSRLRAKAAVDAGRTVPAGAVPPALMPLERRTTCCGALSLSLGKGGYSGYSCPCGDTKVPL